MLTSDAPACPGGVDAPPGLTPADFGDLVGKFITPDRVNRIWASVMVREYLTEVLARLRHAELRRIDVTGAYVKVVISRGVLAAEWSATMDNPAVRDRAARDVAAALDRLKEEAPLP